MRATFIEFAKTIFGYCHNVLNNNNYYRTLCDTVQSCKRSYAITKVLHCARSLSNVTGAINNPKGSTLNCLIKINCALDENDLLQF